ncbi:hypothetical protein Tsedi_00619 [Tepidimonas sediminis]|uniref:Uncharacterized protein n=1 Tax=Tepidimonas sediminis TaxID=2588941 RepID=A0A554WTL6_9BURK|nr:hypothetical protein [Tepidimonas sediminis]TSE26909.1 hypothetical protein Tsedi_00619 [Tepidimonas sediminis]
MGARETFLDLAARGIRLLALARGADSNSGPCRAKGTSAAPVPAEGAVDPGAPSCRTCAACAHRTRAGTCARPAEAGLADHFAIRWPPAEHAAQCPAFERQQPVLDPGAQPHPFGRERRAWTPASEPELRRMAAMFERAVALGFSSEEADCAADVAHWAARLGDLRPCLACAHLRAGVSSRWWCAAQRLPLPQQLVTQPHRCPAFSDLEAQQPLPDDDLGDLAPGLP